MDPASPILIHNMHSEGQADTAWFAASLPTGSAVLSGVDLCGSQGSAPMSESVPRTRVADPRREQPGNQTVG